MPLPIKHALAWAALKFTSTVLDDIWPQVLFFSAVAVMVCGVSTQTTHNLGMNPTMLTVVGTVVSLVVSFKTNNSYARWWDGRNIWANITSNSRQLAMLIWLQVPNTPPPKPEDKDKKNDEEKDKKDRADSAKEKVQSEEKHRSEGFLLSPSSAATASAPQSGNNDFEAQQNAEDDYLEITPADKPKRKHDLPDIKVTEETSRSGPHPRHGHEDAEEVKEEWDMMKGMIEKKTYIGLVQAFAVAMKHALRGESGPFYTDLYSLIAFLPKYNPAVHPPITRDHLFSLWHNGIPRQKAVYDDDSIAVPLTMPAASTGYAFNNPSSLLDDDSSPSSTSMSTPSATIDAEKLPEGLKTTSETFKLQAMSSASEYFEHMSHTGKRRSHIFTKLDKKHRVIRQSEDRRAALAAITTVELMPPRHPPPARYWDFFPPLRVIKVVGDWLKTRKMKERMVEERTRGGKRKRAGGVKLEIPQEILMYLSAYMSDLVRRGMINASMISPAMTAIMELQKAMSDLDKIGTTPIPSAYSFHLRLTVWAYLFFLPFQLYPSLGWLTVPAVAVASITYLGFLEIGAQIEMPFAYDQSDLDLDKFVLKIARQLAEVTAFPTMMPSSQIIMSHLNQPFLPAITASAPEILGVPEARHKHSHAGFAASFPESEANLDKAAKKAEKSKKAGGTDEGGEPEKKEPKRGDLKRSIRETELALGENWRIISAETDSYIGKPRDQLENRTGMEVAVLTL